jgi:GNAT superfamily N-acetyltransferase
MTATTTGITIAPEPLLGDTARELIAELDAELSALYPPEANFFELDAAEVEGDKGVFLVARREGEPVGCGAFRCVDATSAEIKRMYVRPTGRGKGIGRAILRELESRAQAIGIRRMLLETGTRQAEALVLYERGGYVRVPQFGRYVGAPDTSLCFGKDLDG